MRVIKTIVIPFLGIVIVVTGLVYDVLLTEVAEEGTTSEVTVFGAS